MTDDLMSPDGRRRCFGNRAGQVELAHYHDTEWGVPVHDDRHLFEMLTLEGAQAGLSWEVVLRKRARYRRAFHDFDIGRVATMSDDELEALRDDPGIVRNRLKIFSIRSNAAAILAIGREAGSFADYLWSVGDESLVINDFVSIGKVSASMEVSDRLSRDLKARGFKFVGTTIIYAFMQGIGMVNDHVAGCWCHDQPARCA